MQNPRGRVNFYFDRSGEGALAYEFLHKCKSRNKAKFVSCLICEYLARYNITSIDDISKMSSDELDDIIEGYKHNRLKRTDTLGPSVKNNIDDDFLERVVDALSRRGVSLNKDGVHNLGSTVDPENSNNKEEPKDKPITRSTVDPENDLPEELPELEHEDIEEIDELDDIDIPNDFEDALNLFK